MAETTQALIDHARLAWDAERENADRLKDKRRVLLTILAAMFGLGLYKFEWFYDPDHAPRVRSEAVLLTIKSCLTIALLVFGWAFVRLRRSQILAPGAATVASVTASLILIIGGIAAMVIQCSRTGSPPYPPAIIAGLISTAIGFINLRALSPSETVRDAPDGEPAAGNADAGGNGDNEAPALFASHHLHLSESILDAAVVDEVVSQELVYYSTRLAAADLRDRNVQAEAALRRSQLWFTAGIMCVGFAVMCYLWGSAPPTGKDDDHATSTQQPDSVGQPHRAH